MAGGGGARLSGDEFGRQHSLPELEQEQEQRLQPDDDEDIHAPSTTADTVIRNREGGLRARRCAGGRWFAVRTMVRTHGPTASS